MWFFPTRKRPVHAQRLIDDCVAMGMTSSGVVIIDGKREEYPDLEVPENIQILATGRHLEFCGVLNWAFAQFPNEAHYGFISDDSVPRTPEFDTRLERAAGTWHISTSDDLLHPRESRWWTHGVLGGDLLRAIGWWAPPGLTHLYIDNVWMYLDYYLDLFRQTTVVIEELHFSNGKAPIDETYSRIYNGVNYGANDRVVWEAWRQNDAQNVIARVRQAYYDVTGITS